MGDDEKHNKCENTNQHTSDLNPPAGCWNHVEFSGPLHKNNDKRKKDQGYQNILLITSERFKGSMVCPLHLWEEEVQTGRSISLGYLYNLSMFIFIESSSDRTHNFLSHTQAMPSLRWKKTRQSKSGTFCARSAFDSRSPGATTQLFLI